MNIVAEYDASLASAPAGFTVAVQAAIDYLDQLIVGPITVPIMFSYGEIEGRTLENDALGESDTNGSPETYATLVSQLTAAADTPVMRAAVLSLPADNPTGNGTFWVSDAEGQAFGLGSEPQFTDPEDGFAALSSGVNFTFDPNDRAVPGEYDAIGTLEHEITEVLGRISDLGQYTYANNTPGIAAPTYNPLDLYRYFSPGVRDLTPGPGSFSIDGQTLLQMYNDPTNGGDAGDWADGVVGDSFGAGYAGVAGVVTPVDIAELQVLGFPVAPPPAPSDFNDDAQSDILWRNTNGQVSLWLSNGSGGYITPVIATVDPSWTIQAAGDFNGDGKADILWRNANGDVAEWQSNSGSGYTGFTNPDLGVVATSWQVNGVGDFNGDGKSDILWRNTSGLVSLWLSNAGAGYMGYTTPVIAQVDPSWAVAGVGDFNGDGKADILWRNANGDVAEWLSNTGAGYTGFTAIDLGVVPTSWTIQGVGDFNGDGKADILWRNTNGQISLWLSNAGSGFTGYTTPVIATIDPSWVIQGVRDFNGDGKADILWRNTNGDVTTWLSDPGLSYAGFTGQVIANVATNWSIAIDTPPALASVSGGDVTRLSQAMAAMAGDGPAIASTTPSQPSLALVISAPGLR